MCQAILIETQFLPPICSFGFFLKASGVYLEMQENYQKRSYRNRCEVIGPNGLLTLSVPLCKGKNQQASIRDIRVSYDNHWRSNHLNTLRTCYGNAPYFDYIFEGIESVLNQKHKFLCDLNIMLIFNILNFLDLDSAVASSLFFEKETSLDVLDLRNCITPVNSSLTSRLIQGEYQQVFIEKNGFVPNLSILDLLFCLGPETSIYLSSLNTNDLISYSQSKLKSEAT